MDDQSREAFVQVFRAFDSNEDGLISTQEYYALLDVLTSGGVSKLPFMFSRMDRNHNGTIELDEFLAGKRSSAATALTIISQELK